MRIGTVSVPAPDERNDEMTKSSIEVANTITTQAKIAGQSRGRITSRSACVGLAPRSRAASSYDRPDGREAAPHDDHHVTTA